MAASQDRSTKMKALHQAISGENGSDPVSLTKSRPGLEPRDVSEAIAHYKVLQRDPRCQQATPLLLAVLDGRVTLAKYLIQEGADVNKGLFEGVTPLSRALYSKEFEIASLLIKAGADVRSFEREGRSPMFIAIEKHAPATIVKDLISAGAPKDGNVLKHMNTRPIMQAVIEKNVPAVKCLLEQSVDVTYPTVKGEHCSPLNLAIIRNYFEITKLLVDYGVNVEGQPADDTAPLIAAVLRFDDVRCLRVLIEAGADINRVFHINKDQRERLETEEKYLTAQQFAAVFGYSSAVKVLLESGANSNAVTPSTKRTALHLACLMNYKRAEASFIREHRNIINLLLDNGADPKKKDAGSHSPVNCCYTSNNFVALEELIKAGADVNESHGNEGSILTYAILNSNRALVKLCLEHGGDSSLKAKGKITHQMVFKKNYVNFINVFFKYHPVDDIPVTLKSYPEVYENQLNFFDGIKNNDEDALKLSLSKGAEPLAFLKEMRHPIFLPVVNKNLAILKILLNEGVSPNALDENKATPLHIACENGFLYGCFELLKHGACYNSKCSQGQSPLAVAESSSTKSPHTIKLLTDIHELFLCTRKGYYSFPKNLLLSKLKLGPDEVFFSYINCVNRNGNTLLQEAIVSGFSELAEVIMYQRLNREILTNPGIYATQIEKNYVYIMKKLWFLTPDQSEW